jgi:hypothetical protein
MPITDVAGRRTKRETDSCVLIIKQEEEMA